MPINGVLDMQRRSVQIGEIRTGTSVAVPGKDYRRPVRLESFRFTTASEHAAKAVAELYGGEVAPWAQRKGRWEVITDRTALDVWVPPRGEAVDANMELWDGPRCLRRCDGIRMSLPPGQPCRCPQPSNPGDPDSVQAARAERVRLAALRPAQACKPLTRINVTIPDLPGLLGVWRLNTGSENAAVETADSGEAMEIAREGGIYLPAVLRIEWRTRSSDGKPYAVPVLQIGLSMREIADGALPAGPGGLLAQLRGAEQPKALTAGRVGPENRGAPAPSPDVPRPAVPDVAAAASGPTAGPGHLDPPPADAVPLDDEQRYALAQQIADECATEGVASARFRTLWALAREQRATDEYVYTTADRENGPCEPLGERLEALWKAKAAKT